MKERFNILTFLAVIPLLAAAPAATGQVFTWGDEGSLKDSTITSLDEYTFNGDEYSAKGIIVMDWGEILEEFESMEEEETKELEKEIQKGKQEAYQGDTVPYTDKKGNKYNIPYIPGERGENLFFLTEEGMEIMLALDAPVYWQPLDTDIIKWIRFWGHSRRTRTEKVFRRYLDWEPRIKACLETEGVPVELAELCLVESGCTYGAVSPVGAVGMWQFMPGTARAYGMKVTSTMDERLDPVTSTIAAAKLLRTNYQRIGDWTLAAAAYNCGAGRFNNRKTPNTWEGVRGKLPKETQQYIPSLIAVHYVWTYREWLGF